MRRIKEKIGRIKADDAITHQPGGNDDSSEQNDDREETEGNETDASGGSKSKLLKWKKRFQRKKAGGKGPKKGKKNGKESSSDEEHDDAHTSESSENGEDDAHDENGSLHEMEDDPNLGKEVFENTDQKQTVFVTVRIVEGRDVRGGSLRVRAFLDGQQKVSRVTTELHPKWKQNINFTLEQTLEKASTKTLTLKTYCTRRLLPDKIIGEWECSLGMILHQPKHAVISKWVALSAPKEDKDSSRLENCGFLKVSIAVYGRDGSPPLFDDDDDSEEIFNSAQFAGYTLRIRMFRMVHMAEELFRNIKKGKKEPAFKIRVIVGNYQKDTSLHHLDEKTVYFNQEVFLPFLWPTVINKISFQFIMQRGRKSRIIGQCSLLLRELYAAGENGFMPQFGPAFVNFYGAEYLPKLKFFKEKHPITDVEGSKFYGRMMIALECLEFQGDVTERGSCNYAVLQLAKKFERRHRYVLFCTFFACNNISPRFASDSITFHISIGDFGSGDKDAAQTRSSTLPTMPDFDDCKYFYMPWGNHKPLAEIPCMWENVAHRVERTNAILKVVSMLDYLLEEATTMGGTMSEWAASIAVEALEMACHQIDLIEHHHAPKRLTTQLDFLMQEARREVLIQMKDELISLKYESISALDAGEEAIRALTRVKDGLKRLAHDPAIAIPDIIVKMIVNKQVVGYARIEAHEVFYSDTSSLSGQYCGRVKAIPIQWAEGHRKRKKSLIDEVPAVLHLKMWMGRQSKTDRFHDSIQPAEPKTYYELYHYQKRKMIGEWKDLGHFNDYGDVTVLDKKGGGPEVIEGWKYNGFWAVRNTHDRWISADIGRVSYDDKVYELQRRRDDVWKFVDYTDVWGARISSSAMDNPPKGWKYVSEWVPDLHSSGDKNGWMYSVSGSFTGETADREMRMTHQFRRRILKRTRRKETEKGAVPDLFEFESKMGVDEGWEYADKKSVYHDKVMSEDRVRRRRFVIPILKDEDKLALNYFLSRMFEVHDTVSQWQLRAYIFWAKELLPLTRDFSSRAFVRVSYMQMTKQTLVIDKTANPTFDETLIFDKMLIPGSHHSISECPPEILIEVKGERHDDTEAFLGRFYACPTVICSATDKRAKMKWHTLRFSKGKTRGAILCAFELFLRDVNHEVELPRLPARKGEKSNVVEVPSELRPQFSRYTIQLLCWGVRNLKRHKLLSVRRPYVDMIFGDAEGHTTTLDDVRKDPNFKEPLLTFNDVQLPENLHLAPPLIMNLHDTRAFRRRPLIGVCQISNYKQFVKPLSAQKNDSKKEFDWKSFDKYFTEEEEKCVQHVGTLENTSALSKGDHRIDWWSKFYSSTNRQAKAPGFEESGIEKMRIFGWALEDTVEYKGFNDFLDTFLFKKSARGHFDDIEEKEVTGQLKGRLFITKMEGDKPASPMTPPGIEFMGVVRCTVRVYVIDALSLVHQNAARACDPYVVVRCGKEKIKRKKNYRPDTSDPEFGELIEMELDIPLKTDLTITVMNKRLLRTDEEIGCTTIDLENRLLTKFRATVGLSRQYTVNGELTWRDQLSPLATLRRYCKKMQLPAPELMTAPKTATSKSATNANEDQELGLKVLGVEFWLREIETDAKINLKIVGRPAQRLALYILHKIGVVPEHAETRPLHHSCGGKELTGQLRCWIDILPQCIGSIPAPIDISIRKPEPFQLRLAVFNVSNAVVCKRSFGQPSGDLYVKAFLNGSKKGQRTDIHYRILDGFGSFNWRLVLDFEYNPWEKMIYAIDKKRLFRKSRTELVEPLLVVQLWDNNKFKKDTLLGEMVVDLTGFQEGMMDPDEIDEVYYASWRRRSRCKKCAACCCSSKFWCFCCNGCESKKRKEVIPLPKAPPYVPPRKNAEVFKPFDTSHLHGFFPMLRKGRDLPNDQKMDYDSRKKKNDDLAVNGDDEYVTGVVELEMCLLPMDEAKEDPVGKKRNKPNHSPMLEKPDRSRWDNNWLLSRIRPCGKWFWNKYGRKCIIWTVVIVLVLLIVMSIIYKIPDMIIAAFI